MDDEALLSFGQWIRRRRKALDLTQDALAARIGCSKDLITKIEGQARRPSRQIAALLARHLELAPDEHAAFIACARAELPVDRLPPPVRSLPPGAFVPARLLSQPAAASSSQGPLSADFSPPRTLEMHGTNLPAQRTSLVGREEDIAAVTALLRRDVVRLVTLTGSGGVGKTRLALQVAAELAPGYADGVWFIDLAPISDPALVVTTIAQTLGVTAPSERPAEQLKSALRYKHTLLVLDNYEQVLAVATLVAELLDAAPHLTVLATSRVVLHLSGEHEYVVPPLALPDMTELPPPERLTQYATVALFVHRARAAKADFALTRANAAAVAEICVRLDGLPLAIELAAPRVKVFSPATLLARLERDGGLGFLTGGARDLPARQQTIRRTIDWSYRLLSPDEQRLLRRLGVFVGGWTLDAAAAMAGDDGTASALGHLAALVDHSLVVQIDTDDGEARYRMLELVREYTLEQLREAGEEDEARRRHVAYLAAWVEHAPASSDGVEFPASAELARELGNVRAALAWSLARHDEDARYGLRLFGSMWEIWFLRYEIEGETIAERVVACASAQPQDLVAAHAYNGAARLMKSSAENAGSIALLERSLALARKAEDRLLQAEVLRHLGEGLRDLDTAYQALHESLRISRELGDLIQEAWTTYALASRALEQGDLADAERLWQHGLTLFAQLDHPFGQAFTLGELADLAKDQGDYMAADGYFARAQVFAERLGPVTGFSPLIERGQLACLRGEYERALELLQAGYKHAQQQGDEKLVIFALVWQARCHQERGELAAAIEHCRHSLARIADIHVLYEVPSLLGIVSANIAAASQQYVVAARVLGSVAAVRAGSHYQAEWEGSHWVEPHDHALAVCRAALELATFDAAWAAGQALPLEQTIAEALTEAANP
jgi:predicted ATPase/transcriptional regulator with XRE-family HTH domain